MRILSAGPDPDLFMGNTGEDREPGLHLSDITRRMNYERDSKLNPDSAPDQMTLERGYTWERLLEMALATRHKRPGARPPQLQEDGIWMSPDWINPDGDIQMEEWKATKKTMRRGFEDISWSWMPNIMAYVRTAARQGLIRRLAVRIRLWWINGDYTFEAKTSDLQLLQEYHKVDIEFTKRELDENWRAIVQAGRRYGLLPVTPTYEDTNGQEDIRRGARRDEEEGVEGGDRNRAGQERQVHPGVRGRGGRPAPDRRRQRGTPEAR